MAFFTKDYIDFFKELSSNNNRDWFQANKKRYDKNVREPFIDFVGALLSELENDWGTIPYQPREFLMRINRDIRFSKDKTPYNVQMSAMMSPHGKKNMKRPGIYLTANHICTEVFTGCYMLEKENLYKVRQKIIDNLDTFNTLVNDKTFLNKYTEVLGDKHKRLPKEFQEAATAQPLIYNKGFYYGFKLPKNALLQDDLVQQVVEGYRIAKPINSFLDEALTS